MDKWLINMAAGATLAALLVIFGARTFFDIVYPTGGGPEAEPEIVEATLTGTEAAMTGTEAPQAAEEKPDFSALLASASVEKGKKEAKKCVACHTFDAGGADKVGPNLHNVVGRDVASQGGFAYSSVMVEFGGKWDYERLNCLIENPKNCVPGTKMSFAGVKKDSARANVIAYLKSISPDAPPLPGAAEAAPAEAAPEAETEASVENEQAASGENAGEPVAGDAVQN